MVVSNRLRCSFDSTLYASAMHFSGVSTSYSVGVMEPSMRISGGTPAVMCRSEARRCTMSSSSCRRVSSAMILSSPLSGWVYSLSAAVSLSTSSTEVTPRRSFMIASRRSVSIPPWTAVRFISMAEARCRIRSRSVGVIAMTS